MNASLRFISRRRVRFVACAALLASVAVVQSGCKDPTSLREPPPGSSVGGTWTTPSTPEQCLTNLLFSVNERLVANYTTTLAMGFVFSAPADSAASGNPGLYADWDYGVEVGVATGFLGLSADSAVLSLSISEVPERPDMIGDTTASLVREYDLLFVDMRGGTVDTLHAHGVSVFDLVVDDVTLWWVVELWIDEGDAINPTSWADVKVAFR
jgi:hypothetical protein